MTEMSRMVKLRPLVPELRIEASAEERRALAARFGIAELNSLVADVALQPRGSAVAATGNLSAEIVQDCAISGEPFATRLEENIDLLFVEEMTVPDPSDDPDEGRVFEIDLEATDGDEIEYSGDKFDLGEAVAQTLGLAIDPYAEGPDADRVRANHALDEPAREGPFAALKGLQSGS